LPTLTAHAHGNSLDEVTILFADIVSYTDLSTRVGTQELVRMLNAMFTKFDFLCDAHRVTKVETIGATMPRLFPCPLDMRCGSHVRIDGLVSHGQRL
jgi:class 3 adenylate cyclase